MSNGTRPGPFDVSHTIEAAGGAVPIDDVTVRSLRGLGFDLAHAVSKLLNSKHPSKMENLSDSRGNTIVFYFDEGIIRSTVDVPGIGEWFRNGLTISDKTASKNVASKTGRLVGDFVEHAWLDAEAAVTHASRAGNRVTLHWEPKVWLFDPVSGSLVARPEAVRAPQFL